MTGPGVAPVARVGTGAGARRRGRRRGRLPAFLLLAVVGAAACSPVRLTPPYDPVTDEAVAELHRGLETLLLDLEWSAAAAPPYREYDDHYRSLWLDVRSLQLRAAARAQNQLQVHQLALLAENLGRLQRAHREGLRPEEVAPFRRGFEQQLNAILKLELARRGGAEP